MQAKPWTSARAMATTMPAPRPSQAEPVTAAVAAAAKAAPSILPSSAMSTTPERSENRPASAARTSGVDQADGRGRPAARKESHVGVHQAASAGGAPAEQRLELRPEHVLERAAEQDHQALDDHDHLAVICGMSKASSEPPW